MRTTTPIKILSILLCLLFVNSIKAQTQFSVDDIYYEVISASTQQVKVIHNPNHYSGKLVIPDSVTDNSTTYSVTAIGDSAFYNCSTLNYVSIPASVDTIGNYVFYGNSALDTIEMNPTTPPNLSENSIDIESDLTDNVVLSVPCSAYDSYWLGSGNNINYILFTNRMTHYSIVVIYDTICSNKNYTYVDPQTNETIFYLVPADYGSNDDIYENNKVSVSSGNCQVEYQLFLHINKTKRREFYYYVCDSNIVNYNANGFSFSGTAPNSVVNDSLTTCGCDSTAVLYIEMTSSLAHDVYDSVCFGSNYLKPPAYFLWNKMKSTPKGEFYNNSINEILKADTTISDNTITYKDYKQGCTSIKTNYHIKIVGDIYDTTYASICKGETYSWQYNGYSKTPNDYYSTKNQWGNYHKHISNQYDSTGFYSDTTLTSPMGCVTNKYLDLVVYPTYDTTIYDTICYNELPYTKNGFNIPTYKVQNKYYTYKDNINLHTKVNYCDSIVRLELTILPTSTTNISIDACKGGTWSMDDPYTKDNDGTTLTSGRLYYTSGTYADTLMNINGCDSIVKYKVTFNDTLNTTTHREICLSDTIMWKVRYYNPGTKSYSITYTKYGEANLTVGDFYETQTYTTEKGCKDIHNIHIKVYPIYDTMIYDTICYSELPYKKSGFNISKSGINNSYQTTERIQYLKTNHKCDSTVRLSLTIYPTKNIVIYDTICWGNTYDTNNFKINTDTISFTTATKTIQKTNNNLTYLDCDSTTTLRLTILNKKYKNFTAKICYGETYNINGFNINSLDYANKYTIIKDTNSDISILGCDSITTLTLTIAPTYDTSIFETICYGQTYKSNGFNIDTNDYKVAGYNSNYDTIHYRDTLYKTTIYGCDSIIKLDLLINPKYDTIIYRSICLDDSYKDNNFDIVGTDKGAGIFTFTTENLHTINNCDSTITLVLTINSIPYTTINENICYGEVYNEYGFTVNTNDSTKRNTSFYVRDSLKLTSTLGCDSIVRLNLSVNPTFDTTITENICWGSLYNENNFNILTTDSVQNPTTIDSIMAIKELTTINGCDSTVRLKLYVYPTKATNFDTILLQGQTYTLNGFDLDTKNISTNTDTTIIQKVQTLSGGCDSIVTLNVHVWANDTTIFYDTLCQGESYTDNNFNENTTGTFTQDKKNIHGADSTIYLYLVVNPTFDTTITTELCYGEIYSENNFYINTTDYESILTDRNLTFKKDSITQHGCDSIIRLNLTIHPIFDTTLTQNICFGDTYQFNTHLLDNAGYYTDTLQSIYGCDSVVHLQLNVHPNYDTTIIDSICYGVSYTLNNFNVSQEGIYLQELQSIWGCDSIVHLELKVMDFNDTIKIDLCPNETYTFHNKILSETGFYRDTLQSILGCDSIINVDLTIHSTYNDTIYDTVCGNLAYTLYNFQIDTSQYVFDTLNYFSQHLQSSWGCDSSVVLALWVYPSYSIHITKEICEGGHYNDHGYELYYVTQDTTKIISAFTTKDGCDSIFILDLYVRPTHDTTIFAHICKGETYTLGGYAFNLNTSGVYKDTVTSYYGCDSIKTINLTVHDNYEISINDSICLGSEYNKDGFICTAPGIYKDTIPTYWGCDSVRTLFLWPKPSYNITFDTTICRGLDFYFGDRVLNYTGQYIDTLSTIGGCDSIVTLYLTINDPFVDSIDATICNGETYTSNGFSESEMGRYEHLFSTVGGCDSLRILNLHVKPSYNDTIEATICQGDMYTNFGFSADKNGYYTHSNQTFLGCDSITILHLQVNETKHDTIQAKICKGEIYNENNFSATESGEYVRNLQTSLGCDSIVTLLLTVNNPYIDSTEAVICYGDTYPFDDYNLTEAGRYEHLFTTTEGCDSVRILNLTVNDSYNDTIEAIICKGETYTDYGFSNDKDGYYIHSGQTYLGCDSIITLHLLTNESKHDTIRSEICQGERYSENNFSETESGEYVRSLQTYLGCDSIVYLLLTVYPSYNDTIYDTIKDGDNYQKYNFHEQLEGIYTQYLLTSQGCDSIVTLNLELDKEAKLWMANAFTPRDNNNNRYYAIPQTEDVVLVSFKIFDRQGTLLWETDDITQGWDGKYKGEFVQQGAYVYLVEYYDRNRKNKHHVVKDMFMLVH